MPKLYRHVRRCRCFTLVELLIVVVLLSILASASQFVYIDSVRDAKLQRTVEHFRLVHRAAQSIQARTGSWPLGYGTDIDAFDEYLGEDVFTGSPPVGLNWYYSAYRSGVNTYVELYAIDAFGNSQEDFEQIDALIDDGIPTSGLVRTTATFCCYRIE